MRQIQQRLGNLFKRYASQFIQHDRQDNRYRESGNQAHKIQPQGISQRHREVRHAHHELEVIQPDPFASPHALEHVVLLECDNQADHRFIAKDQVESHRQDQHHIQPPVPGKPAGSFGSGPYGAGRHLASSLLIPAKFGDFHSFIDIINAASQYFHANHAEKYADLALVFLSQYNHSPADLDILLRFTT